MSNNFFRRGLLARMSLYPAEEVLLLLLKGVALGVPLAVLPGLLHSPVDLPKRLLLEALILAALLSVAIAAVREGRLALSRSPLVVPIAALGLWASLSGLCAVNPAFAMEAWGGQAALLALAFIIPAALGRSRLEPLLLALLAAGGIEGVYGILQYAGVDFLPWASSWGSRCFGTIGNPIFFAEFLAPLFVLSAALWIAERDEERKDLFALLVLVVFLALLFSQTRGAWVGAAAGLAVLGAGMWRIVPAGRETLTRNRGWLLAFAGFAVAVVLTSSSATLFGKNALPLRDRVLDAVNFEGWTVRHRLVLWRSGALMLRGSPLVGVGTEHYRTHFPFVQSGFREDLAQQGFRYPPKERKAHNDYVQLAGELGVVGLGLTLWLLASVFRLGLLAMRSRAEGGVLAAGLVGGCLTVAVAAFFNFPFRTFPAAVVFWIFSGSLALLESERRGSSRFVCNLAQLAPRVRRFLILALGGAGAAAILAMIVPPVLADRAFAKGMYHARGGFWEMAEDAFSRSVFWRPFDAIVHYHLGFALFKPSGYDWRGRLLDRALGHFKRARALGLNDEQLYGQMALLYEKKGNLNLAVEMGEIALTIYPDSLDFAANQAFWLSELERDLDRADELSRRAVEAVPRHPLYLWTRGLVLEKLGRLREGAAALESARGNLKMIPRGGEYEPDLVRDVSRLKRKLAARGMGRRATAP